MAETSRDGDDGWLIQQTSESPAGIQASSSIPSYIDVEDSSCTTRSQANDQSSLEIVSCEGFSKRTLRSPYPSASGTEDDGVNRIKRCVFINPVSCEN